MRGFTFLLRPLSALLLSVLGLALSGCLLGPDYVRPTVPTPATFRFETTEAAEVANAMWWEQFKDPVLNDLIAMTRIVEPGGAGGVAIVRSQLRQID